MKKHIRLISLLLAVALMLFAFTACGNSENESDDGSKIVMSYGNKTLSEKEFMYIISLFKSQMIEYYQSYFAQYGISYSESDILELKMNEDTTFEQYIKEIAIEFAQQLLIYESICEDADITITDQEDIDMINGNLEDMEIAFGGTDLFEINLAKAGITRTAVERYLRANVLYELLFDYRYGDGGIAAIPAETVNKEFLENYYRYDGALYAYKDYETNESYSFEYSDEAIEEYFNTDYVKVRHVLYLTVDSSNKKLSDEKVAEKKAKAEAAFAAVQSGEKTLADFKSENEDSGSEYVFTYGKMVEAFEKAAFEMEIGEVRLVETEYGFHIVEKLEKTLEDLNGTTDENGKVTGGCKDEVIEGLTAKNIRSEALELLEKLQSGEISEYPKETDAKPYYLFMEPQLINKNDTTYATFIEMVSKIEIGKFDEKNFAGDATYVIRRLELTEKDITADIYSAIEEDLAFTAFSEYVQSFYDKVTINKEILDSFDVVTIPNLDSDFYTFG